MRCLGFLLLCTLFACSRPIVVRPSAGHAEREAQMLQALRSLGQPGDWIVIRGYHRTDHLVSAVTNSPFSHAALLDAQLQRVIEAEGVGIHATPLDAFTKKAQRMLLIRPIWASDPARGQRAVAEGQKLLGRSYDYLGLVGINDPHRYYCSELVVQVYGPLDRRKAYLPPVIPPHELLYHGRVVWDSGAVPGN